MTLIFKMEGAYERACKNLIEKPEGTEEFDDFIDIQIERLKPTHTVEDAARIISRTICILYYRRHPREDLKLLYAII